MSRELSMDTQRLNFWKESIEKEALARYGRFYDIQFLLIVMDGFESEFFETSSVRKIITP